MTGEKKEVWRLTVENASTMMKPEQKDREENIYRDVSSPVTFSLCAHRLYEVFNIHYHNGRFLYVCSYTVNTRTT